MRIVVVGAGASGVHFALTALERGHAVTMLDVGRTRPPVPEPDATWEELKDRLDDPASYFLGPGAEAVVYPATRPSYYGHPPSKEYVFAGPEDVSVRATSMVPLFTLARGGFAEAWTAGAYQFLADDLSDFPIEYSAIQQGYQRVAERIGLGVASDDLDRFFPAAGPVLPPLPLDSHSAHLLTRYQTARESLQARLGFFMGRSRVATLSQSFRGRQGCSQCGRCLWGCPTEALYRPSVTLLECERHEGFRYVAGARVQRFSYDETGRITGLVIKPESGGVPSRVDGELYVLAAGTLATSAIVLASIRAHSGQIERLTGLMDNRQVHVPFLTPAMLGQPACLSHYQFHHLAFGLTGARPRDYVHAQITTLRAASVHPIVQSLPLDLPGALSLFQALRPGLGLANLNFHDSRRRESWVSLLPTASEDESVLDVHYADAEDEAGLVRAALSRTAQALRRLGCLVPPGMTRILPKGTSVHYSGTLPMGRAGHPLTCSPEGRLNGFANLLIADGASFPFLPAKNLTLTLMANAVRLAEGV